MERTTYLSLLFLLLVVVIEIWVFCMETNRRVKALRVHVFTVLELLVWALVWYIWKRVTYIFKSGNALSVSSVVRATFFLLLGFAQACIVVGFIFVNREPAYVTKISSNCLGVVILLGTCLGIMDIISFFVRVVVCRGSERKKDVSLKTEIKWRTLLAFVAAVGLSFAGLVGISRFTVEKLKIPIQGLHPRLNGTTIVQLSDVHLGGFNGRSALQRIVSEVNQLDADIVVITGDLVDEDVAYMREMVEPLGDIKSKHGMFFATGVCYHFVFSNLRVPATHKLDQ